MDDKHDPNAGVPIGTFTARTDDGQFEIPIEVVTDDEIESRQLALSQDDPLRFHDDPTREDALPRRKRVATLLGVPLPGTLPEANDPTRATRREINAAVDSMLEEQPTTIFSGRMREVASAASRDSEGGLQALESLVESEMIELPPSHPPGEIVGVKVARESETGTFQLELREDDSHRVMPVLAPAQFVEARQRDQSQPPTAASAAAARATEAKSPRAEKPARAEKPEPVQAPISSLAPREIARPAASRRAEPASPVGIGLVAAMVLLGIGGWWWTAGGYKRMSDTAPQPTAAARPVLPPSEPLASAKVPAVPSEPEPVVAPPAPTPPPIAPAEQKPRVASKTVRKVAPPPPPAPAPVDSMAETPSRSDVLNGLDGVRTSVQACAEGRNGVAEVDLTIAANGVVTNALVGGDFGGTPQGSCIARAVRKARFPVFKQDRYRVLFPYVL